MTENCEGAKFEILLDGEPQSCRDTMLTAMGAATFLKSQHPKSNVAVRIADRPFDRSDAATVTKVPRGEYLGRLVGGPPKDEVEHFIKCPACDGWINCRNWSACSSTRVRCPTHPRISRNDRRSVRRAWDRAIIADGIRLGAVT